MIDLLLTHPNAIQAGFGNTIFYYGVEPNGLSQLPDKSEFTLVYSPSQEYGWEAVQYRVLHPDKTYFVVNRRDLSVEEMHHFEHLLETLRFKRPNDDQSNQQITFSLSP